MNIFERAYHEVSTGDYPVTMEKLMKKMKEIRDYYDELDKKEEERNSNPVSKIIRKYY